MTESSPLNRAITYIFKLAMLTLALSFAVKFGGEYLHLPEHPLVALAMLLTPAIIVALRLAFLRSKQSY